MLLLIMRITAFIAPLFLLSVNVASAHGADANAPVEVYVRGQQPMSAATEQTRWQSDLDLQASNTPSDVLRLIRGLIIGPHHDGGKGDQILLRGFDSAHGTDFMVLKSDFEICLETLLVLRAVAKIGNHEVMLGKASDKVKAFR